MQGDHIDGISPIAGLADHLHITVDHQELAQAAANHGVVIDK